MATWTAWAENSATAQYNAQQLRQIDAAFAPVPPLGDRVLGAVSGRRLGSWLVGLSGSTIVVGPGVGIIDYTDTSTQSVLTPDPTGPYRVASDVPDASLTLAPAHSTLDRLDMVCVRVNDSDVDGSGVKSAGPLYMTGVPGQRVQGQLVRPPIPELALPVAYITVPADGTGNPSVTQCDYLLPNPNNPPQTYTRIVPASNNGNGVGSGGFVGTAPAHWAPADFAFYPVRTGPAIIRFSTSAIGVTAGFGFGYHKIYQNGAPVPGATGDTVVVEGAPLQYTQSVIYKVVLTVNVLTTFQIYVNAANSGGSWRYQYAGWDATQY